MAVDVSPVLKELLASNRGPSPFEPEARQVPDYGVSALLDGNTLVVVLTFQKNAAYCCMEWGCHLPLFNGKRWDKLHRALEAHGVAAPQSLRLQLCCVIEEGAIFFDFSKPDHTKRGRYAFAPVAAYEYQASTVEAGSDSSSNLQVSEAFANLKNDY
jgi:hypothetical protein